jgi:hypothetical protein
MKKRRKNLPTPTHNLAAGSPWSYWPLLILAALCVCIAIMRMHTYNEPFERDITSHAVIAHEMLAGRQLYSDLWDSKPPAIFVTYAIADALVGYGPLEVYFIGVVAAVVTLLGVYRAGSALGGVAGGLWSSAFWAFICSDMWLWANQPNIEVCINACLVWAFALMIRTDAQKLQPGRWLAIGGLFALATFYKPVAISFAGLLAISHILTRLREPKAIKLAFSQLCIAAAVSATAWAALAAYFAAADRLTTFYQTVFQYGSFYIKSRGGNTFKNILEGFTYKRFFSPAMRSTKALALFATAGTIFGLWKGNRRYWLMLAGFALAAQMAIAFPGRFYPHYYQLWLGPLVIGAGWAVAVFGPKGRAYPAPARYTAGAIGMIILLSSILPQYKFSADEWSAKKINPQFVISRKVVAEVDKLLKPGETLYVWGQNPEFYFWSKRSPPTGLIWSADLMDNPLAEEHTTRALADLEREKPDMFVVNILQFKAPLNHPVIKWVLKNYVPLPGNPNRGHLYDSVYLFRIFIRKGSNLAARLGV